LSSGFVLGLAEFEEFAFVLELDDEAAAEHEEEYEGGGGAFEFFVDEEVGVDGEDGEEEEEEVCCSFYLGVREESEECSTEDFKATDGTSVPF